MNANTPPNDTVPPSTAARTNPPKPPLVFHVGVTGHRPDRAKRPTPDEDAIRRVVREVLGIIGDAVRGVGQVKPELFDGPRDANGVAVLPTLRLLSSLAEGADQWVAREAVKLSYELQAPLPFSREEYAKDFDAADGTDPERKQQLDLARIEFDQLLCEPTVVFELDGSRSVGNAGPSYLAAGRQTIRQSDILLAVWDGDTEKGAGGTAQVVRDALLAGVPVVWIPWSAATGADRWQLVGSWNWRLLEHPDDIKDDAAQLRELIAGILLPPDVSESRKDLEPNSLRPAYVQEIRRKKNRFGGFWSLFLDILAPRPGAKARRVESTDRQPPFDDYEGRTRVDWDREVQALGQLRNSEFFRSISELYLPYYAWANQLSVHYAGLYRSSFVANYLLGAMAVFFALLGLPALLRNEGELPAIFAELLVIAAIVASTRRGQRHRWHERWLEYRTLAERLRLARLMALLGGWRQQAAMPGHLAGYGDPVNSWVYWYLRAVERSAGLPRGKLDHARQTEAKLALQQVLVSGQIRYHGLTAERFHTLDHRLHLSGYVLFGSTFVACLAHFVLELEMTPPPLCIAAVLTILNALLPAFGAALAAIRSQGEFQRLVRRSEAMERALKRLQLQLGMVQPQDGALKSQDLRRAGERVAQLMLDETLEWRVVFEDRPLVLPS